MSIKEDMIELQGINNEIKNLNAQLKELRNSKKQVEERIIDFLNEKELPGFKDPKKNISVVLLEKETRTRKKENEKKQDIIEVLEKFRSNRVRPDDMVKDIQEALKGPRKSKTVLKIERIKKD
jgi:hypothetical protein